MKIALANNLYHPYSRGGAETVVAGMISDLKAAGHEVFLLTTEPGGIKKAANAKITVSEAENPAFKIYRVPSAYYNLGSRSKCFRLFWHLGDALSCRRMKQIKKVLQEEKPDLAITHNLMGLGLQLPRLLRKLNIRQEHYLHDIQLLHPSGLMLLGQEKNIDSLPAKIYQLITRSASASPAKVISPSAWLLAQHRQRGFFSGSETEIRNLSAGTGMAALKEKGDRQDKGDRPAGKTNGHDFLFVGQIEEHKGIRLLAEALLEAAGSDPEIKLTVVGDGSKLPEIKKMAAGNGHIIFRGRLDSAAVRSLMEHSHCLVVPSLCYENAPMTINEAHAAGLPVLAANIGGIPEMAAPGDRLFKAGDKTDLIKKLLED